MLIAAASRKASPGVTTLTGLLAAYWDQPAATRLILEADPSGGSLAARWSLPHDLSWDPGLLALSVQRRRLDAQSIDAVAQHLADGLWVASAPPGPDQIADALDRIGDLGAADLAQSHDVVTFADCGRLDPRSPAMPLARQAALTVLVCRPRLDEVQALIPAVDDLRNEGCRLGLVTVGSRPFAPAEVAERLDIELLGVVADDQRAAEEFNRSGLTVGRSFRRSQLAFAAEQVTDVVQARATRRVGPERAARPRTEELRFEPPPVDIYGAPSMPPSGEHEVVEGPFDLPPPPRHPPTPSPADVTVPLTAAVVAARMAAVLPSDSGGGAVDNRT